MTKQQPGKKVAEAREVPEAIKHMAGRYGVAEDEIVGIMKRTCFKDENISDAQLIALCVVADQYQLNPFTKELFAFPDKKNGIVPVVSVDGWTRIINEHPQFDGLRFEMSTDNEQVDEDHKPCPEYMTCFLYRKDRGHPIEITEYLDEVYRPVFVGKKGTEQEYTIPGPWQSHTKRMLRHKTLIQAARIAFGFAGIYDKDEAERIIAADEVEVVASDSGRSGGKRSVRAPEQIAQTGQLVIDQAPDNIDDIAEPQHDDAAPELVGPADLVELAKLCMDRKVEIDDVCAHFKAESLADLELVKMASVIEFINETGVPFD